MTSTRTHETTVVPDPDVPLVRVTREFDATPAQVFRAHTDPDLVVQWLVPNGLDMHIERFACHTGGSYRYVHTRAGEEHWFNGCFHLVRPSEIIIQTFTWEEMPDDVLLERLVFEDLGEGRTRLVSESLCASFEARDSVFSSGMEEGLLECYDKLDELFAR
jgi:uncharacterized protein YndB with AHSA1/START domain